MYMLPAESNARSVGWDGVVTRFIGVAADAGEASRRIQDPAVLSMPALARMHRRRRAAAEQLHDLIPLARAIGSSCVHGRQLCVACSWAKRTISPNAWSCQGVSPWCVR